MVNLEWYRTFKAVYQTGSLTAAAKILFVSQPNVGQHLNALEAYVGKQLFERKPQVIPTEYGKLFYTQVIEALEKLEGVEEEFNRKCIEKQIQTLRIGSVREFFHSFISKQIDTNTTCFQITFGQTAELVKKLKKGELDFIIAAQLIEGTNMVYEPIFVEEFVLIAHPLVKTEEFDIHIRNEDWKAAEGWLEEQIWFTYDPMLTIIRRFWLENFRKRSGIRPTYIIPDLNIILESLTSRQGITITANYLAKKYIDKGLLKEIWGGNTTASNTLYLAYDKTQVTTKQISKARKLVDISELK